MISRLAMQSHGLKASFDRPEIKLLKLIAYAWWSIYFCDVNHWTSNQITWPIFFNFTKIGKLQDNRKVAVFYAGLLLIYLFIFLSVIWCESKVRSTRTFVKSGIGASIVIYFHSAMFIFKIIILIQNFFLVIGKNESKT